MNSARQVFLGILAAVLSAAIVLGSFSLAFIEGGTKVALATKQAPVFNLPTSPASIPNATPTPPLVITPKATPSVSPSSTNPVPVITATGETSTAACTPPSGWQSITVQSGNTLESLASLYQVTPEVLSQANCLDSDTLQPGSNLFVPALSVPLIPTDTASPEIPCGAPYGWVLYTVRSGDTLYSISQKFSTTVSKLQVANCLGASILIHPGDRLYVPNVPGNEPPFATPTRHATHTPVPTQTPTTVPATHTPTSVPSPTFTATRPTSTATATQKPPTDTPVPTKTPTFTPLPSSTDTAIPTDTSEPPTATSTITLTPKVKPDH